MKKFLSAVIACIMFLCAVGCVSEEEKFFKARKEWAAKYLNYDTFQLLGAYHVGFRVNGIQNEDWCDFNFVILSSEDVYCNSLKMDFNSNEEFVFNAVRIPASIIKKGEWLHACVAYEWGKQIDSVSCTLHYTATDGRTVSKDYVLDFTQTPFEDGRNR